MVFAEVLLICVVICMVHLLQEGGLGILGSHAMVQDGRSLDPNNKYRNINYTWDPLILTVIRSFKTEKLSTYLFHC
jgi:hypothetical protein